MRSRMKLFATEVIDEFATEVIHVVMCGHDDHLVVESERDLEGIGLQHSHLSAISFPERLLESNRPSSDLVYIMLRCRFNRFCNSSGAAVTAASISSSIR